MDPDEAEDLLPGHVSTREELDELEEANIQLALIWAEQKALTSRKRADVLTEEFLYELHRRMFARVWKWAGQTRRTNKNIGIDKLLVRMEVRNLIQDARHWREHAVYGEDEIAIRFHHRLVSIHAFPNGNGRHARLMADLITQQAGRPRFSWGGGRLTTTSRLRTSYIRGLREADSGDLSFLIEFARS